MQSISLNNTNNNSISQICLNFSQCSYVSMVNNEINETWLWTKAPIYFIEPPSIFQFTSLLFNHHDISKQVYSLEVLLPSACCNVSASSCFNKDNNTKYVNNRYLGVLTNEVSNDINKRAAYR